MTRSTLPTRTIAICTGCRQKFLPGPYFKRRIVRHLRLLYHNHDAAELIRVTLPTREGGR